VARWIGHAPLDDHQIVAALQTLAVNVRYHQLEQASVPAA
jgi:hypothetical protein